MVSHVVLFAGGGSGGHISPGLAIAERLAEVSPRARAIFACSERAIDREMLTEAGAEFIALPAAPPSLRPAAALRFVVNYHRSVRMAREIISRERVQQVVALGGFVAAPVVRAAAGRVPVTLLNLDAPPGLANRFMAPRADRILSAVGTGVPNRDRLRLGSPPNAMHRVWGPLPLPMRPGFASEVIGMPIRRHAQATDSPQSCRESLGLDRSVPTLLITGASQGAASINAMMIEIARTRPALFAGWQVFHLSGRDEHEPLRAAYERSRISAVVQPFIHRMGLAWGAADLAVSRAGASSVAEVAANAVPTIFLPYPHHRDQHQRHNARPLVEAGGTLILDDRISAAENARHVGDCLEALMRDDARRAAMRVALKAMQGSPPPGAATDCVWGPHGGSASDAALRIARILVDDAH